MPLVQPGGLNPTQQLKGWVRCLGKTWLFTPPKSNIDTKHDVFFFNVYPFKHSYFGYLCMLDFSGVN